MATEYKYIPIVYKNGSTNMDASVISKAVSGRSETIGSYYTTGNAAFSADTITYKQSKVIKKESADASPRKGIISTILVIIAVFIMLSLVLAGNAKISGVTIENSRISNEIASVKNEISDIELEISLATDLDYIQQRAAELGMGVPSSDQIVYVQPQE